ncbi:aspartate dehydrogenase [Lentibacillus halophilus]|uniref:L-aspartate dehydrogenase n=1 Tax=Lentibacillus halophilus TaxID=295065 RepID=A0ABP3JBL7_9BACI
MNIGIVGAGAIGNFLMKEINHNGVGEMRIQSVFVRDQIKYQNLEHQFNIKVFDRLDAFLDSGIDIVVEAANIAAVHDLFPKILSEKDVVLISIGALADEDFLHKMNDLAETYKRTIHLPTGAVGGLDLLQNAHTCGGVTSVSLTTRKPAQTLIDEYVSKEVVVFDGHASEAIKQFPKNINVSIILSLAGVGIEQTNVTIIADPTVENNIHTIDIEGSFGSASLSVTNNPLAENPKTSHLAAMSVLGTLDHMTKRIKLGG